MTQPTQGDIDRLVKAATQLIDGPLHRGSLWIPFDRFEHFKQALRPFQPDPEAEVIEQMAEVLANENGDTIYDDLGKGRGCYEHVARKLIAVVKEHKEVLG